MAKDRLMHIAAMLSFGHDSGQYFDGNNFRH